MKRKFYFLIILMLSIFMFEYIDIKASKLPLMGKIIYLDPGHGGKDPGSIYKNIYEKDINLQICSKLKNVLEKNGATVYMTRYADYDLSSPNVLHRKQSDLNNRVRLINDSKSDMYISIHLNASNSTKWHGAQVFYDDINEENKKIATIMQDELTSYLNTDRQISEISNMLLNRKIVIPGILIEIGFLSNNNDRYLLKQNSYQNKVAKVISNGIIKYFK